VCRVTEGRINGGSLFCKSQYEQMAHAPVTRKVVDLDAEVQARRFVAQRDRGFDGLKRTAASSIQFMAEVPFHL
jgi:hypothetical protein